MARAILGHVAKLEVMVMSNCMELYFPEGSLQLILDILKMIPNK